MFAIPALNEIIIIAKVGGDKRLNVYGRYAFMSGHKANRQWPIYSHTSSEVNPLSAGDAFKRIHTVFPQLKFDRN